MGEKTNINLFKMSVRGEVWVHKTSLTPKLNTFSNLKCLYKPEDLPSRICVLSVSTLSLLLQFPD